MASFLTDDELSRLAESSESQWIERKRSASDGEGIRKNICAFANDLSASGKPGVIFVGLEDNGDCARLTVDDALLTTLADMRSDGNTLPLPSIRVEKKVLQGCEMAVIVVEPSPDTPVRYKGRVWVKVGPTVRPASPAEENRLAEKRRSLDLPFDMRPAQTATEDDLDLEYVQRVYLPSAIASDVLAQNARFVSAQLRSLRLLVDDRPSWGGLIACGRHPQFWVPGAYVQFVHYAGTALTSPVANQKALSGRLDDVLRRLDDLLTINIATRTNITDSALETRYPDYPIEALYQLARNAVMHRSYEGTNAPTRISWFSDRIEIRNPGSLYGTVTPENLGEGVTDYRNPVIAEFMRNLGFAQRFGVGVPLARQALRDNGNPPPEFAFPGFNFVVTIKAAA